MTKWWPRERSWRWLLPEKRRRSGVETPGEFDGATKAKQEADKRVPDFCSFFLVLFLALFRSLLCFFPTLFVLFYVDPTFPVPNPCQISELSPILDELANAVIQAEEKLSSTKASSHDKESPPK